MDSHVPPQPPIDGIGTPVGVQLRIFKIVGIDVAKATLSLFLWFRTRWVDSRLAWDPSEFGGVTEIRILPGSYGGSEAAAPDNNMWTPDLRFYNAAEELDRSLETGAAWVYPNGSVFRSQPGLLQLSCRFTGLINFPYDQLSCPFDLGAWQWGDNVVNLTFYDDDEGGGVELRSEETVGVSYQQFAITSVDTSRRTYKYACCPEPYSMLFFRMHIERPAGYYFLAIEFPSVLLTIVSMAVFWLDATNCGERLGFGVTTLLAVEVTKIVTNELLPVCGEILWVTLLLLTNELVCVICVLESCLAVYVAYKGQGTVDEHLADTIDFWSRRLVPPIYFILLGVIYSISFDDGYMTPEQNMYYGLATGESSSTMLSLRIIIAPLVILSLVAAYLVARKAGLTKKVHLLAAKFETRLEESMDGTATNAICDAKSSLHRLAQQPAKLRRQITSGASMVVSAPQALIASPVRSSAGLAASREPAEASQTDAYTGVQHRLPPDVPAHEPRVRCGVPQA